MRTSDRGRIRRLTGALLAIAMASTALAALTPAHANTSRTATYLTGPPEAGYVRNQGDMGIGGYIFVANGEFPHKIKVEDTTGNPVAFRVCQDFNGDGACSGDERVKGCTNEMVNLVDIGWRSDLNTAVFIRLADPDCAGQGVDPGEAIATTGTITFITKP